MRLVAVDGRAANASDRAGIGVMTASLLRALPDALGETRLMVYIDGPPRADLLPPAANAEARVLPPCRGWTQRALHPALRRDKPCVFYAPGLQVPLLGSVPAIATCHDLGYLRFPETFTRAQRLRNRLQLRMACATARAFIVPSEATAHDLERYGGVARAHIHVVPEACRAGFDAPAPAAEVSRVRTAYGLEATPYVLYVGRIQPRKNLVRLFEAFAECVALGAAHRLVIAGGAGWMAEPTYAAARSSSACERIAFLGHVPDADLPALITGADALALVSQWEGFGLPVLEAMACGTPVLTSNVSSLPEVAGDAALLVNPEDTGEIAKALGQLLNQAGLRDALRAKGLARAGQFSWTRSAEQLAGVLRSVAREAN